MIKETEAENSESFRSRKSIKSGKNSSVGSISPFRPRLGSGSTLRASIPVSAKKRGGETAAMRSLEATASKMSLQRQIIRVVERQDSKESDEMKS